MVDYNEDDWGEWEDNDDEQMDWTPSQVAQQVDQDENRVVVMKLE